jgi:glycosyltransferase involved in cell wall biosynthesis
MLTYTLITPARNEESLLPATIRSVVSQTVLPKRWIIVSDGSTDRTDTIVEDAARQFNWIELFKMPQRRERQFAAKANCFNAAYERLKATEFDLVGNLDADITFDPDYYSFLLKKFEEWGELGVAGTPFVEDPTQVGNHSYSYAHSNLDHVSGACQMFRRQCFDQIGGYVPIKGGGIDWVAVTSARMNGWKTRTFLEKVCFHHRKMGTATRNPLAARFKHGQEDYYVGGHPLWQLMRGVFQMRQKPFVLGGTCLILGFFWALVCRFKTPIPAELRAFHRREQVSRMRRLLFQRG